MPTTFDHAYRVDVLSLGDNVGLFSGELPPSTMDTSTFPVGSVYYQTDGRVWKRTSPDADGWTEMAVTLKSDGQIKTPLLTSLDFTGAGVSITNTGGAATVNIPLPFFLFILADSTAVFIPWAAPGILPLTLTDGSIGTLTLEN